MDFELSSYYPVFLFVFILLGFVLTTLVLAHMIGPRRITPVKQMPYESGMDPIGSARQKADVRFYLIAILFLVFDVELLFLYPWAVSAYELFSSQEAAPLRTAIFYEMLVFLATLAVAYVYAWRKGVFQWR
jgi:NADH:ubiquinone oxidoreductase subunit 3 (subunit A)